MKDLQIELLKYFNDVAVGEPKSISPFIVTHFKKPSTGNYLKWASENKRIENLLDDLISHEFLLHVEITEDGGRNFGADFGLNGEHLWYDKFEFFWYKTIKADEYLNQVSLNNSIIEVNGSIAENNRIISKNSDIQTKAITKQTYLLIATACFTFLSLIISYLNYFNDQSKEQLKQQLTDRTKQIDSLKNQLYLKDNSLHELLKFKKWAK